MPSRAKFDMVLVCADVDGGHHVEDLPGLPVWNVLDDPLTLPIVAIQCTGHQIESACSAVLSWGLHTVETVAMVSPADRTLFLVLGMPTRYQDPPITPHYLYHATASPALPDDPESIWDPEVQSSPNAAYAWMESLSQPGRRLQLYGVNDREGWTTWGPKSGIVNLWDGIPGARADATTLDPRIGSLLRLRQSHQDYKWRMGDLIGDVLRDSEHKGATKKVIASALDCTVRWVDILAQVARQYPPGERGENWSQARWDLYNHDEYERLLSERRRRGIMDGSYRNPQAAIDSLVRRQLNE